MAALDDEKGNPEMQNAIKLTCMSCGQVNRLPVAKLEGGAKCAKCGALLLDGDVAAIGELHHDKATKTDELPLIVDYWAPWCGPCKMMAPEFAGAAKELRFKARFAKIDTEQLQIRGIPLLILYAKGQEIARLSGARPAADIAAFVQQHL